MEHARIVTESELEAYADHRSSQDTIPELLSLLVPASVPITDLLDCRIPHGNAVGQPGWDGFVNTKHGFHPFVPAGASYWELGCGADPQSKATKEFRERTKLLSAEDRGKSTFIFMTPRSGGAGGWPVVKQQAWIKRRKNKGWKAICILDGTRLADWLREFPSIARWIRMRMGLSNSESGVTTAAEYWQTLSNSVEPPDPPFMPQVFLCGRDTACVSLRSFFNREINRLQIQYEDPDDVGDFVSAFLESLEEPERSLLSSQCLFIRDEEAWQSFSNLRRSHFLIAHPKVDLESNLGQLVQARDRGHCVILPTQRARSEFSTRTIRLASPSRHELEEALKVSAFLPQRASELSNASGNSLIRLKRYVMGVSGPPDYASGPHARELAQALMIGRWDGTNKADQSAIENLLGKSYGEWVETIRMEVVQPNAPLTQRDEKYKYIARHEAWQCLLGHMFDADLDAFQNLAIQVLGEIDPALELPPEEHYSANILGHATRYSAVLKSGLAETLAMLGAMPVSLSSCSIHKPEAVAAGVTRQLLEQKGWKEWATLNSYLPLIAEASPSAFLEAVESTLEAKPSPYIEVFSQERQGITGRNYLTGLLWALETLAWDPKLLSRVTLVLGGLAKLDPGGNWANRPSNSLTTIYLPWYPQTVASPEQCLAAVNVLCNEYPSVGWQLLCSLLPGSTSMSTGSREPTWRDLIPSSFDERPRHEEYVEQVKAYARLTTSIAQSDLKKLQQLVDMIGNLPSESEEEILDFLVSDQVTSLSESDRLPLWESLIDVVNKHQRHTDATWALPADALKRISDVTNILRPSEPSLLYRRLFSERDFELYEGDGNWDTKQARLKSKRSQAIQELLASGGIELVLRFSESVGVPGQVGNCLAAVSDASLETEVLPELLGDTNQPREVLARGYTWGKFQLERWQWVDSINLDSWRTDQVASFFAVLPFDSESWSRAEKLLQDNVVEYWKRVQVNPP